MSCGSLRWRFNRSLAAVLALSAVATIVAFASLRGVVSSFDDVTGEHIAEATWIDAARDHVDGLEARGQGVLTGTGTPTVFFSDQVLLDQLFAQGQEIFAEDEERVVLEQARSQFRNALERAGLTALPSPPITGSSTDRKTNFSDDLELVRGTLQELDDISNDELEQTLAHARNTSRIAIAATLTMFLGGTALSVIAGRRLFAQILGPVSELQVGAQRLQSGQLDYRVSLQSSDEFGELADAFNSMAEALDSSRRTLQHQSLHDNLTSLANRAAFMQHLRSAFDDGHDREDRVLFVDVDDFKIVNDTSGHAAGDELLRQIARRLVDNVRGADCVARLGGDEFAILIKERRQSEGPGTVAERLLHAFEEPFVIEAQPVQVGVSIGVATRSAEARSPEDLLRHADIAMYMAKGRGKGCYELFDTEMHDSMLSRAELRSELGQAVRNDELRLDYQPIADLNSGRIIGLEALVRWEHPTRGLLSPGAFIGLAEESTEIDEIGRWVLEKASQQIMQWRELPGCEDVWVSVNVSAYQLRRPASVGMLISTLTAPGIDSSAIVLEITETAAVADNALAVLHSLKSTGARIAIDDFGTGFSSLSSLTDLPVDVLKIDRAFVSGRHHNYGDGVALLEAVVNLGKRLGLQVIAEGIEQVEQLSQLRMIGCGAGQGFSLIPPVPAATIERVLRSEHALATTPIDTQPEPDDVAAMRP